MLLSPVQRRNETRRGKAGPNPVKRTEAEGVLETAVETTLESMAEIGAGIATKSVSSECLAAIVSWLVPSSVAVTLRA
jgi:hypothetical protein